MRGTLLRSWVHPSGPSLARVPQPTLVQYWALQLVRLLMRDPPPEGSVNCDRESEVTHIWVVGKYNG